MKRPGLQMDDFEIVQRYRHASNKQLQIGILADLNACDKDTIKKVLKENGVDLRGGCYHTKDTKPKPEEAKPAKVEAVEVKTAEDKPVDPEKTQTAIGIIKEACVEICKDYCRYRDILDRKDNSQVYKDLLADICKDCPLKTIGG